MLIALIFDNLGLHKPLCTHDSLLRGIILIFITKPGYTFLDAFVAVDCRDDSFPT